jgi:hypothetical protein
MIDYKRLARRYAQQEGLDPDIFQRQIGQESRFNPKARSPAGARGIAQIMPETARGWHVNPDDPDASLRAAAHHMALDVKKYGSYENALRAYNAGPGAIERSKGFAETNAYVKAILRGHDPGSSLAPHSSRVSLNALSSGASPGMSQDTSQAPTVFDVIRQFNDATTHGATPGTTGLDDQLAQSNEMLMAAIKRKTQPVDTSTPQVSGLGDLGGGGKGSVKITGPNPGRIKPSVISFAKRISEILGEPIVGSDGTGHSRLTVNGNVSQHTTGNATDIPATGKDLIKKGQAALIAAGMDPAEARKQQGGLYNVNGHQIIFNTHEGGDHTNHLHISALDEERQKGHR